MYRHKISVCVKSIYLVLFGLIWLHGISNMVGYFVWFVWFVGFYGISTFIGYLTPNPFLCK